MEVALIKLNPINAEIIETVKTEDLPKRRRFVLWYIQ